MYHKIGKRVDGNILCGMHVSYVAVDEENQTVEQLVHYVVEGAFDSLFKNGCSFAPSYPYGAPPFRVTSYPFTYYTTEKGKVPYVF